MVCRSREMQKSRIDLFTKKLRYANHPESYKSNATVEKFAGRKTFKLLWCLRGNGVNTEEFIELSLLDLKADWRYNVVMSAIDEGAIGVRDVKHIIAIDDFALGMSEVRPEFSEEIKDALGGKRVCEHEKFNVDKCVRKLVGLSLDAIRQDEAEGKGYKSALHYYNSEYLFSSTDLKEKVDEEVTIKEEDDNIKEEIDGNGMED